MEEKINYIETNKGRKIKRVEVERPLCRKCALYESALCERMSDVYLCDENDIWEEVQQ